MPRAGKTTQVERLQPYLEERGFKVAVIDDRTRASQMVIPIADSLAYVIGFAATALNESYKHRDEDFLLIDRGLNDVRVWANFYLRLGRVTQDESFALVTTFERFARQVALTLNFQVAVDTAVQRHIALGNTIEADELIISRPSLELLEK